jgi:hypothetical protein
MQKWEYLYVLARPDRKDGVFRIFSINGVEVTNWESGHTIPSYLSRIGDEGWELVAAPFTESVDTQPLTKIVFSLSVGRFIFKRPKE